jgi:hypothetical protein
MLLYLISPKIKAPWKEWTKKALQTYSPGAHYEKILKIYQNLVAKEHCGL